jgi:hypothetical protein
MTEALDTPEQKSFLQQWGSLITFGVLVCALFVGARLWIDHAADAPVDDGYAKYLNSIAANSRGAAEHLERYYARYSRRTAASRHFESMCGAVTVLADHDGFDPERISVEIARACRMFTRGRTTGEVPDL